MTTVDLKDGLSWQRQSDCEQCLIRVSRTDSEVEALPGDILMPPSRSDSHARRHFKRHAIEYDEAMLLSLIAHANQMDVTDDSKAYLSDGQLIEHLLSST